MLYKIRGNLSGIMLEFEEAGAVSLNHESVKRLKYPNSTANCLVLVVRSNMYLRWILIFPIFLRQKYLFS
jgi:hypothetical protein